MGSEFLSLFSLEDRCPSNATLDANDYDCILEKDRHGDIIGCRDMSHLANCGKYFISKTYFTTIPVYSLQLA